METKTQAPSFTVSLRGYDREEVDEYLDSLAEALAQVEQAEERSRRLQQHVARANARIRDLEERIRADTPRSGVALGERIGLLLREAEEAAAATISRAESDSARIIAAAEARSAEAEELMRSITSRAEEQARRIEAVARGESAEIISEAEARAAARTRQIEQWAEQVVSHTRAEEARMLAEQQRMRMDAEAQLQALAGQRAEARRTLTELREVLGRAVGLVEDDQSAGADVAREDVAGAEVAGAEVAGAEVAGAEVVGAEGVESGDELRVESGVASRVPDPDPEPEITDEDRTTDTDPELESPVAEETPLDQTEDCTVEIESLSRGDEEPATDEADGESQMLEAVAEPMAGFYSSAPEPQSQLFDGDAGEADATPPDGMPVIKLDPQFEAKLDAWVAGADED